MILLMHIALSLAGLFQPRIALRPIRIEDAEALRRQRHAARRDRRDTPRNH